MSTAKRTTFTAVWAALHTLQYGFGIGALNGVQDALTCSASGRNPIGAHSLDDSFLKPCVRMSVSCLLVRVSELY